MRQYPSGVVFIERNQLLRDDVVNHNKLADRTAFAGDGSFEILPYQLGW